MLNTVHNLLSFLLLLGGVLAQSGVWFNTNTSRLCPDDNCTSVNVFSAAFLQCCDAPAAASCDTYTCPIQTHYQESGNHSCVGTVCQLDSTVDLEQCCEPYPTCGNSSAVNESTCNDYSDHINVSFVSDAICPESGCSNQVCCLNNHTTDTIADTCHDVCRDSDKKLLFPVPVCNGTLCNTTTCCVDNVQCSDQIRCEIDETLHSLKNCTDSICTHDECCSKTPVLCYKAHETNTSHVCDTDDHFYVTSTTQIYNISSLTSFEDQCCEDITGLDKKACDLSSNTTCADPSTQMYSHHFSYDNSSGLDNAAPASCCIPKPTCKDDFNQENCKHMAAPTATPTAPTATPTAPTSAPTAPTATPTASPTLEVFNNDYQAVYPPTKVKRDWVDSSYIDNIFTVKIKGNFRALESQIGYADTSRRRLTEKRASVMIAIAKAIYDKNRDDLISVKIDDVTNTHIQFEVITIDGVTKDNLETAYGSGTTLTIAGEKYTVTSVEDVTANIDLHQYHLDFSWQLLVPYTGQHEDCTGVVKDLDKQEVIKVIEGAFTKSQLRLSEVEITHLSCTDTSHVHCACEAAYTDDEDGLTQCKKDDQYASIHYTAKTSIHSQHNTLKEALESVHANKNAIHDEVIAALELNVEVFTNDNIDKKVVAEVDESCFNKGFSPGEIFGIVLGALILSALLGYGIYYLVLYLQGRTPYVPFIGVESSSSSSMVFAL